MAVEINPAVNPYAAPRAVIADSMDEEEYQHVRMFTSAGRRGRVRYLGNSFVVYLIGVVAIAVVAGILGALGVRSSNVLFALMGLIYVAMVTQFILGAIQRNHDMDHSGWWVLLFLIPAVNFLYSLYLLFAPGTKGPNRFGPPTAPNSTGAVILACLMPIAMVGILAAVAIPAYQQYAQRAAMHGR